MKKRGTKLLGYYLDGPMFPCVRNVRPLFGPQDAAIQTIEIVIHTFEGEYGAEINEKLIE